MPSGPKPVAITMLGAKFSKPQRRTVSGELPSSSAPICFADSGVHSTVSTPLSISFFEVGRGWGWGNLFCAVMTIPLHELQTDVLYRPEGFLEKPCLAPQTFGTFCQT